VTPGRGPVSAAPAGYAWEPTSEQIARRYGLLVEAILRFDLNTSPTPPALAAEILAAGRFVAPVSEYPPSDYRSLAEAAAARYGVGPEEVLVGAGADEVLDLCAKAFLAPGERAVIPSPSYAMYRVLTEQRQAVAVDVPRRPAAEDYAADVPAVRAAARDAALVWLCSPNNPTALPEPDGAIEVLLAGLAGDADADGRVAPLVVLDEAYAEFAGKSLVGLRAAYPRLVVVRTASKAYALAGLRVGFALAPRDTLEPMEPYRPPGSVSVVSVTVVTEALRDPAILAGNLARVEQERRRLAASLRAAGWRVGPSVTNFLLVDIGTIERCAAVAEALLRRGLVPRTFPVHHALADHLRFTVRSAWENDRLIEAMRSIADGSEGAEVAG
jgi:histidinol-phosphate aminotransferase